LFSMPESNPITVFAKTNFRNQERVFGIKADDRRRHMYIIGKTGMGKTNLLENLAIQDIRAGHGMCFIDPHGDVAQKLIKAVPPERINDVIYFDPSDQKFPIAFNILEQVAPDQRSLVASGLVGVFKKIWADSWGPRLEYILRNAILALLEYPGSTLLGVMRILVDKSYRERVVEKVTDPVVKAFWRDEFAGWNERVLQEVISPIQNKVGQFTSNSLIRNIIGQTTSAFNVREIMDGRKILIMNLAKGKIGEDSSALLGAMMITKIQLAAMGRVDIPEEERKDFYLYVDEFQNFATDSFANILSEARKYRLALVLANQYITQLDEKVQDAIFGNAGTIISFRVGATDAEFLEKEFEPVFMMNDLVNLPKYNIYLKLMIDGIAGDAFSATTLPPIPIENPDIDQRVIAVTRERYAASQDEVEDKIRRWTGMLTDEEKAELLRRSAPTENPRVVTAQPEREVRSAAPRMEIKKPKPAAAPTPAKERTLPRVKAVERKSPQSVSPQAVPEPVQVAAPVPALSKEMPVPKPAQKATSPQTGMAIETLVPPVAVETVPQSTEPVTTVTKTLYPSTCATCGMDIEVPFQPDDSRPTFCKDCLRDYQRAVAKAKKEEEEKQAREREENGPDDGASSGSQSGGDTGSHARKPRGERERHAEPRVYASAEAPVKLSQTQFIAPKKFKTLGNNKKGIDRSAVRALIENVRPKHSEEA
jgi:CxxC-x17-CxxC domain-containing protein